MGKSTVASGNMPAKGYHRGVKLCLTKMEALTLILRIKSYMFVFDNDVCTDVGLFGRCTLVCFHMHIVTTDC